MKIEVYDNFLHLDHCNYLMDKIENPDFPWTYCPGFAINDSENSDDLFMFTHMLVKNKSFYYNDANLLIDPIMYKLKEIYKTKLELLRAKVNLFTKSSKNLKYGFHYDIDDEHIQFETIIYYLNTNDGGTEFEDGTIIKSKKNRALIVYGREYHQSVGQTDTSQRILFNINYKRI